MVPFSFRCRHGESGGNPAAHSAGWSEVQRKVSIASGGGCGRRLWASSENSKSVELNRVDHPDPASHLRHSILMHDMWFRSSSLVTLLAMNDTM